MSERRFKSQSRPIKTKFGGHNHRIILILGLKLHAHAERYKNKLRIELGRTVAEISIC